MNRFIHISSGIYLAFIIFVRMLAMPISLIDYSINKNYIATNLCENRLRPEMNCHGKCYLKKKLAKSNEGQESQNQNGASQIVIDYCEQLINYTFSCAGGISLHYSALPALNFKSEFRNLLFRPPIA
jgi:hypothetical protein